MAEIGGRDTDRMRACRMGMGIRRSEAGEGARPSSDFDSDEAAIVVVRVLRVHLI